MADYLTTDTELTSIADAIRTKGGTSAQLSFPTGFVSAIQNLPSGGGSTLSVYYLDSNIYSLTTDGTYGENVTTIETNLSYGDTITLTFENPGGIQFSFRDVSGDTLTPTYIDSFSVGGGGGFPPMPPTNYVVYQFTMPSVSVVIYWTY